MTVSVPVPETMSVAVNVNVTGLSCVRVWCSIMCVHLRVRVLAGIFVCSARMPCIHAYI